jgi:hypothetical protein
MLLGRSAAAEAGGSGPGQTRPGRNMHVMNQMSVMIRGFRNFQLASFLWLDPLFQSSSLQQAIHTQLLSRASLAGARL